MLVTIRNSGHSIAGIRIGSSDACHFFPSALKSIDIELDHLRIQCDLHTDVWHGREISDPRLAAWLEEKFYWRKQPTAPLRLEMVKTGGSYRLQLRPSDRETKASFGLVV